MTEQKGRWSIRCVHTRLRGLFAHLVPHANAMTTATTTTTTLGSVCPPKRSGHRPLVACCCSNSGGGESEGGGPTQSLLVAVCSRQWSPRIVSVLPRSGRYSPSEEMLWRFPANVARVRATAHDSFCVVTASQVARIITPNEATTASDVSLDESAQKKQKLAGSCVR
jgi:hypothetical protein